MNTPINAAPANSAQDVLPTVTGIDPGGIASAVRKPRRPTPPRVFVPLADETRLTVDTATAAHHTGRMPQTLRGWAMNDTAPEGLRPHRLKGRLAWPVAGLLKAGAGA